MENRALVVIDHQPRQPGTVLNRSQLAQDVHMRQQQSIKSHSLAEQVGGGDPVARHLQKDPSTSRPIWSRLMLRTMQLLQSRNATLSPPAYPYAAEDVDFACRTFLPQNRSNLSVAVFSAISPWVELVLFRCLQLPPASLTTVEYNAPLFERAGEPTRGDNTTMLQQATIQYNTTMLVEATHLHGVPWRTINARRLADEWAVRGARFDAIVSFSGVEHDGLGRYGDELHPDGDLVAMSEMHHCLTPGGLLLLGVPTNEVDLVDWPNHRLYGPVRLPWLLQNFTLLARVRLGRLDRGWERPSNLFPKGAHWTHQPVLVLQKQEPRHRHRRRGASLSG